MSVYCPPVCTRADTWIRPNNKHMTKSYDILVAGEINPDLILSGDVEPAFGQVEKLVDSAVLAVGSSSVITACGAARLGLRVAFIGVCGDDLFGRFMLEEMQARGVDTSAVIVDPAQSTGLTVILNRPFVSGSRYAGKTPATRPSILVQILDDQELAGLLAGSLLLGIINP